MSKESIRQGSKVSADRPSVILKDGWLITMNPERRVLEGMSVLIEDSLIVAIAEFGVLHERSPGALVIDCRHKAVLPGLVDLHGYLGGSIFRSVGEDFYDAVRYRNAQEFAFTRALDEKWWRVEARMCATERLKLGTTCMFSMLGTSAARTDDLSFARIASEELNRAGLRSRIGIGPARPPWPRQFSLWQDGKRTDREVSFEEVITNCDTLLSDPVTGIVDYCLALSRIGNRNAHDPVWSREQEKWVYRQAGAVRDLMQRHDVGFFTHMYGNSIEFTHDEKLGLLGPKTILSHCTDISERSIHIMKDTGTHGAHHPRTGRIYSHPGRIPLPEMIEAGVNVGLGCDNPANHDCDIFADMREAMYLQRVLLREPDVIPPGKALEMATIDGYRALGLDRELGSIEVGKRADLITIDLRQPYFYPLDMLVHRLVYNGNGRDVADVLVDGRLVMRDRKLLTIDEDALLDETQVTYRRFLNRTGLAPFAETTSRFWSVAR